MMLVEWRRERVVSLLLGRESRLIPKGNLTILHHLRIVERHALRVAFLLLLLLLHKHRLVLNMLLVHVLKLLGLLVTLSLELIMLNRRSFGGGRGHTRRASNSGNTVREDALVTVLARSKREIAAGDVARDIQRRQVSGSSFSGRGRGRLRVDGS